ncbi:hypothetical protein [Legionella bononiensis]|uniref:Dot/Icm T4SS effector n=1 Tax=Legionella bononiensis TaxID=2793102 RepID=A0ABS1WAP3_9GAMM|nr:hypothetical protein [Legionella bononiensis]MBL7480346.1 hypothetical protein [Legionella bononiensis]MBL7526422.1 hypothetical protein [Legionella bononiensis]MBL7563084.1 hypothetical protein [Legionella bononiensis]
MGYEARGLPNKLPGSQSEHGWQLRVHIDPKAVDENNPDNKISVIRQCVSEAFKDCAVEGKIFVIRNDEDGYDGAMSQSGKDRTQLGKEVCIYLPDSHQKQITSEEYKQRLSTLWQLLQKNGVPLLHLNVPGDQMITIGDTKVPSPFSFTSQNPDRQEWKDKHGILFKQFKAHGEHPILNVSFSPKDLSSAGIVLESSFEQSSAFLKEHQTTAHKTIEHELESINSQDSYLAFLNDDTKTKEVFKSLINDCQGMRSDEIAKKLQGNEFYQRFLDYPQKTNSNFDQSEIIDELYYKMKTKQLTEADVDLMVDNLRKQYASAVEDIVNDFKEHNITVGEYDIEELVNKNPKAMQIVFRQQALINQERDQNSSFLNDEPNTKELDQLVKSVDALIKELDALSVKTSDKRLIAKSQEFGMSLQAVRNQMALDQLAQNEPNTDEDRKTALKGYADDIGNAVKQHADNLIKAPSVSNFFLSVLNACIRVINTITPLNISEYAYKDNEKVPLTLKERLQDLKEDIKLKDKGPSQEQEYEEEQEQETAPTPLISNP